jgi:hypothetical protein
MQSGAQKRELVDLTFEDIGKEQRSRAWSRAELLRRKMWEKAGATLSASLANSGDGNDMDWWIPNF